MFRLTSQLNQTQHLSVFTLQLLSAASLFQLGALQRHCELICSQHINLDNAVSIYKTAKVTHFNIMLWPIVSSLVCISAVACLIKRKCRCDTTHCVAKSQPCPFFSQAHISVELSSFCEGYFLQQMSALLERDGFRSLLLGPPGARQGNNSTSMLAHSRGDSPLEELEATLAQRLRSLYVTSRV